MESKGFTLIELLVVIAIIVILSTVGLTIYADSQKSARGTKIKQDITSLSSALESRFGDTSCGATATSYCAPEDSWFVSGIPKKPDNTSYATLPLDQATTYCICAQLEKETGNYCDSGCVDIASDGCTPSASNPTKNYFCAKSRQ